MRRAIIAGNWKMNKTLKEAVDLANGLKRSLYEVEGIDIVICPPFTALSEVANVIKDSNIQLGAQDTFWQEKGAFTGEVSPSMLKDVGCDYVIIGHSERRQYFAETDENVNKKLKSALECGLIPIFCVGENLEQRQNEETFDVVKSQIEKGLAGIDKEKISKIIIAYEPVWAIGTGRNATPQQAEEVHIFIRRLLTKIFTQEVASRVRIQYGGSITPDNISELMKQADIDGGLVGGASLIEDSFVQIVKKGRDVKCIRS